MKDLKEVMKPYEEVTPLLAHAWETMSEGYRQIMSREDPIVTVSARAKEIAAKEKDFVRSDIGQIVGIMPELEVHYGPPIGKSELRNLIAEFWARFYELGELTFENVAITTGATEALGLLISLLGYRQKVILASPYWPTLPDAILRAGSSYKTFEIVNENGNLNLDGLKNEIKLENIKTILINFPNNPSGIALSKENMVKFAQFARENDLIIISDEVYNRLRFTGEPQTMLSFAPERTVVVSAASKEYLIPGHRVGYVISKSPTLADVFLKKLVRCQSSCPGIAGQDVVLKIMSKEVNELKKGIPPSFLKPVVEKLKERRDTLGEVLKSAGFTLPGGKLPDGSIFMMAKIPEEIKLSDTEFVRKALDMKKISAIPGTACGKPGWLRFSFGSMTVEDIRKFGHNLKELVNSLKK